MTTSFRTGVAGLKPTRGRTVFAATSCLAAVVVLIWPVSGRCAEENRFDATFSLFLAGDMIVMRPMSHVEDERFLMVVDEMREADTTRINLETLLHDFQGYAQIEAGGFYMASPPDLAEDFAWAGIDMVSTASNHTFDYGSIGVLENIENLAKAKIIAAG